MKTLMRATVAGALLLGLAAPAWAHPKLVSSTPAANATVANANRVTLTFSERLMPRMSGVELAMTGLPGMANPAPMKLSGLSPAVDRGGTTKVVNFARTVSAGTRQPDWHEVSAKHHRTPTNPN